MYVYVNLYQVSIKKPLCTMKLVVCKKNSTILGFGVIIHYASELCTQSSSTDLD